ncbi:Fc.00g076850.m01.CDS01 [Cosmosporella sp. VM-42]
MAAAFVVSSGFRPGGDGPPPHPYFPPLAPISGYVPNDTPLLHLVSIFGVVVAAVVGSALRQTARSKAKMRGIDHVAASWFALCGFLHVAFEGYYLYHRNELASMNTPFAQLWKEYALSDSRYLTNDVFTISVETVTALVWGPLSWLTFLSILTNARTRHVLQVIVCTAHLESVALYYMTNWTEQRLHGVAYSRPEALYFWVYYVGFNAPWAVMPLVLLRDSWNEVGKAFEALGKWQKEEKDE